MFSLSLIIGKSKRAIKVTVGLCVKNSEKTVKEAIESIINQEFSKELMEIIVVDGTSKDKTLSIVKSTLSKTDIQSRIYSDKGKGLGYARQIVVDNAYGEYIVWVDDDMTLLNDFFKNHMEFMEKNPRVGVAVGKYMYTQGNLLVSIQSLSKFINYHELASLRNFSDLPPDANGAIYRVKAIRQVNGFDENIRGASEDKDIIRRIKAEGWLFSLNNKAKFYHYYRETLRELWKEQIWYGYGNHYISHKYKDSISLPREIPIVYFIDGLRSAIKGYKLTHEKKLFTLPLLLVFKKLAWWFGFIKGHLDGYGHEIQPDY